MNKVKKAKGKQDTDLCPSLQSIEQVKGRAAVPRVELKGPIISSPQVMEEAAYSDYMAPRSSLR